MYDRREYFDLSEANTLIPMLEFYFAELARIQREVNEVVMQAEKLGVKIATEGEAVRTGNPIRDRLQSRCTALASEYADIIDEIHEMGVMVEDPDMGSVNFYSHLDGEEVILSWQYGEREVAHWFRISEDFMARRPLRMDVGAGEHRPQVH